MRKKKNISVTKLIISTIGVVAGCITIVSFILAETRHPEKLKKGETQVGSITNAISELIEITKEANSNESSRGLALEKSITAVKSKSRSHQMWSAAVHVSGAKNVISFVASSGDNGVPKRIGGAKSHKTVPIPENCQLIIHVSGVKNRVLIDEKLRGHVTVAGVGSGCSVSWVSCGQ